MANKRKKVLDKLYNSNIAISLYAYGLLDRKNRTPNTREKLLDKL